VGTTDNEGSEIWVYDLSGDTQIRQLTLGGNNLLPIWTPDGQRVTFTSDRDGKLEIYWQPADGSGLAERLATAEEGTALLAGSWSPDGKTLALMVAGGAAAGGIGVWTLSHEGETTTPEVFADESGLELGPVFSPDGRWLAYLYGESDTFQVYVQPFPKTGAKHRVTQQGGAFPLWSPDGNELFYFKDSLLMGIDVATEPAFVFGNEQALGMRGFFIPNELPTRSYDITPDGQQFLMVFPVDQADSVAKTPDEQIHIVLNWFEELKERVPVP